MKQEDGEDLLQWFLLPNRDLDTSILSWYVIIFRQKISKEEIPELRSAMREVEAEWDRKWMDTLKDTPLVSFLNEDPVSSVPKVT